MYIKCDLKKITMLSSNPFLRQYLSSTYNISGPVLSQKKYLFGSFFFQVEKSGLMGQKQERLGNFHLFGLYMAISTSLSTRWQNVFIKQPPGPLGKVAGPFSLRFVLFVSQVAYLEEQQTLRKEVSLKYSHSRFTQSILS